MIFQRIWFKTQGFFRVVQIEVAVNVVGYIMNFKTSVLRSDKVTSFCIFNPIEMCHCR